MPDRDSSVPCLFRIVAVVPSIEQYRIHSGACKFGTSPVFDLLSLFLPSVEVRSISVSEDWAARELLDGTLKLVHTLRATIAPGVPAESLEVWCSSPEEVAAVGELIAHTLSALTSLNRYTGFKEPRRDAKDMSLSSPPLDWNVPRQEEDGCRPDEDKRKCKNVSEPEDVVMTEWKDEDVSQPDGEEIIRPSRAAIIMSSQVSGTVRDVIIWLHDLPCDPSNTIEMLKKGRLEADLLHQEAD
ncbi:hypothetical protein GSI_14796 [Ganoderma sinense ZZ0214-1]|uniref:Uncharacterized protein n=1 Tax=Ganoderma sinense ZZ0214-1 TaxID=1077348 RepID=A0A2G8RPN7_9APHY|nr:hypothetical protein GSI_14796 [Ganoderma sinense ZZ0214-1]